MWTEIIKLFFKLKSSLKVNHSKYFNSPEYKRTVIACFLVDILPVFNRKKCTKI